jgi:MFS family permease
VALRFFCGFLGINSGTLRKAAVQNYLPKDMRARVNGLFSVIISIGMLVVQLVVGALGEIFPYQYVTFGFAAFTFLCTLFFIVKNRSSVQNICNKKLR